MATIKVYTTPTCPYCKLAKDWLNEHGCPFDELDITKDVNALREWRALTGGTGVPTIAHGNDLIVGFSPERMRLLLESCEHTTPVEIPEEASG